jgi:hypothetical protein
MTAALLMLAATTEASTRDCTLTPPTVTFPTPDYAPSGAQLATLLAKADGLVTRDRNGLPATPQNGGWLNLVNISQSNGLFTFDAMIPKLQVLPHVKLINGGSGLKGIDQWADRNNPAWTNLWGKLKNAKAFPQVYVPWVTQAKNVGYVWAYLVSVSPGDTPPADLEAYKAGRRAKMLLVLDNLRFVFPEAMIAMTGMPLTGWVTGSGQKAPPWSVIADAEVMMQLAQESADLLYVPHLTDGDEPRAITSSASFPNGRNITCADFQPDGIHEIGGVPGVGYEKAAQNDAERIQDHPVFYRLFQ